MSSIPDDDEYFSFPNPRKLIESFNIKDFLPPLPEDHMALSGDVLALFVYSYLDHTVSALYAEASTIDVADLVATSTSAENAPSLPVWFDPTHLNEFGH